METTLTTTTAVAAGTTTAVLHRVVLCLFWICLASWTVFPWSASCTHAARFVSRQVSSRVSFSPCWSALHSTLSSPAFLRHHEAPYIDVADLLFRFRMLETVVKPLNSASNHIGQLE